MRDELANKIDGVVRTDGNVEQVIDGILRHSGGLRSREELFKFVGDTEHEAVWMAKEDLTYSLDIVRIEEKYYRYIQKRKSS